MTKRRVICYLANRDELLNGCVTVCSVREHRLRKVRSQKRSISCQVRVIYSATVRAYLTYHWLISDGEGLTGN